MEAYYGQIILFAGNFAPKGWAFCHGQLLPISQNTALFALLGTTYGGDGKSTFALPDLRGRVPIGIGEVPGLSWRDRGETWGDKVNVEAGTDAHTTASIGMNYIIALQGVYPPRG